MVLVFLIIVGIEKGFVSREKIGVCYGKMDVCVCEVWIDIRFYFILLIFFSFFLLMILIFLLLMVISFLVVKLESVWIVFEVVIFDKFVKFFCER